MSLHHKDYREYGAQASVLLDALIERTRDRKFEAALADAFFLYSFMMEDFGAKATKNQPVYQMVGIMLVQLHDVLRGVLHGQTVLSPATIATLTRVALELRCTLSLIFTREDPLLFADRFVRYAEIEKLVHDSYRPSGRSMVSPAERERITRLCPEWFASPGEINKRTNWTAEKRFSSVAKIAGEVGLLADYESTYWITSHFVHGSALLLTQYMGPAGVGPIGQPSRCRDVALLAVNHCMETMRKAALFFGVPFATEDYSRWQERLVASCPELQIGLVPRP